MRVILTLKLFVELFILLSCVSVYAENTREPQSLKEAFKNRFYIGTALNLNQIWGRDTKATPLIEKEFNSIVAENCMKSMYMQPREGVFYFKDADKFVELGEKNNMFIIGHTLIWHSQSPDWFFKDKEGNDVTRDVLIERMKNHITTIVTRYKGRIHGWDVVNEAFEDDGSLRDSKFLQIIGEDYLKLAFDFAREADPDGELYYNDYSMSIPSKREGVVKMIKKLQGQGVKIDGIGMQGHIGLDYPSLDSFEESIIAFSETGAKVMVTEFDINVLPNPRKDVGAEVSLSFEYQKEMNPYAKGLSLQKERELERRYIDFFELFLKYQKKITRVTLWGISDQNSWLNDWPMKGRTNYPLLFDREYKAKSVVAQLIDMVKVNNTTKITGYKIKNNKYLVSGDYMADPSVHVFDGKLFIYPSHDWESGIEENDNGDHFNMKDYHVFSLEDIGGALTDHGVVLKVEDIPWAGRQLWDCDVAFKNGKYYMYFPLKDKNDIFRMGVAISDKPYGPFIPQKHPMMGSYSIDPAVFEENGKHYMYFGGIWGGQLQRYRNNKALESAEFPADNEPSICPKVALLSDDMLEFAETPKDIVIFDENGNPLTQGDTERRFFEASWMHKYNGKYYFSYSTGDTHKICYAIGDNPYGPFIYQGVILTPVVGWTTHHSIVEFRGKWYLFHHDSAPSGGKTWLRSMKVVELEYNENGTIKLIEGKDS